MKVEEIKFNINYHIKVKLKPEGVKIYKEFWKEFAPNKEPDLDAEGYYQTQLWALMEVFGQHIHFGFDQPFETEIILLNEISTDL